nr:hypothetical protein [Tanacetum cinerariifolium]
MIQVKEMMQDKDLIISKSNDEDFLRPVGRGQVPLYVVEIFVSLCRDFCTLCRDLSVRLSSSVEALRCVSDNQSCDSKSNGNAGLMTSGDARSCYMISGDAKSWVYLHIFTMILHNCSLFEILAQRLAGGVQISRVPISLHDDPYVAIRQAHLVDTDTESELEEAPSEAEESQPLGIDPHMRHHHLWPFPHERGFGVTSELVLDTKTEDESSNSDAKREGHGLDDEGHGLEDEGPGSEERGLHLRPTLVTWVDPKDGRVYTDILTYPPVAPVENRHLLSDSLHAAMQRELQEMRGRVVVLEQERGRKEQ